MFLFKSSEQEKVFIKKHLLEEKSTMRSHLITTQNSFYQANYVQSRTLFLVLWVRSAHQ